MEVIFYQIGILIAVQIAAKFGRNSRNTAIILISIFTILQVFMSWLLVLQFITIFVSYHISEVILSPNIKDDNEIKRSEKLDFVSYRTENGGRGLMSRADFEALKEKEKEEYKIYSEENKEIIEAFNQKSDKEKLEGYRKILDEMTGRE